MTSLFVKLFVLMVTLLGLPFVGVLVAGMPPARYLEFPPYTRYIDHPEFSWTVFVIFGVLIFFALVKSLLKFLRGAFVWEREGRTVYRFPWWGGVGVTTGGIAWILAWNRFEWFAVFQPHTFILLWMSYILVINGLSFRRKGQCMITSRKLYSFLLFPASSLFWWFFEYLNRFVQNWYYVGFYFSPWEYFWYATLSFSTVLPAVLGTREWLLTYSCINRSFKNFLKVRFAASKGPAYLLLIFSGLGLSAVGVWPNFLFPLVWLSPLIIVISLQVIKREHNVFSKAETGDWTLIVSSAVAALFCGFFWEMWNYRSLAKWEYSVPFLNGLKLFEMPVLGYAGYLPFGIECAVAGGLMEDVESRFRS